MLQFQFYLFAATQQHLIPKPVSPKWARIYNTQSTHRTLNEYSGAYTDENFVSLFLNFVSLFLNGMHANIATPYHRNWSLNDSKIHRQKWPISIIWEHFLVPEHQTPIRAFLDTLLPEEILHISLDVWQISLQALIYEIWARLIYQRCTRQTQTWFLKVLILA